jgi:hypothetical protein
MIVRTGKPYPAHIWEVSTGLIAKADFPYFTIGTDDVTLVKDLGPITDRALLLEIKEHFDFVQAIRAQEKTGSLKIAAPVASVDDDIPY